MLETVITSGQHICNWLYLHCLILFYQTLHLIVLWTLHPRCAALHSTAMVFHWLHLDWLITNGTVLWKSVCMLVCLQPYTVHYAFSRKFNILMHLVGRWRAMQGYCQSAVLVTQSEDGLSWSIHGGNLLLVCYGIYGPTINGRLLADRTNYGARLRLLQVRVVDKKALINGSDSAHGFSVKLSLFMCSHGSCSGWRNVTICNLWHLPLVRT